MRVDRELLEIFLDEARGYLARLRVPGATLKERAEAAHGLKGASSMLGFDEVRAVAMDLERRIRERDAAEEERLLGQLEATITALTGARPPDVGAAGPAGPDDTAPPTGVAPAPPAGTLPAPTGAASAVIAAAGLPLPLAAPPELDFAPAEQRMLQAFFVDEAREHLDGIVQGLLSLARSEDPEVLRDLFRKTHTLKGAAGTVGLRAISERAHELESRFARWRDSREPLTEDGADGLLAEADALRALVEAVADEVGDGSAAAETTPALPATVAPAGTVHPPERGVPAPAPQVATPAGASALGAPSDAPPDEVTPDGSPIDRRAEDRRAAPRRREERPLLRVDVTRLDQLMDAVGELVFGRTRIERRAQELQGIAHDLGESRRALRGVVAGLREAAHSADGMARLSEVEGEVASAVSALELTTTGLLDDTAGLRRGAAVLQDGLTRLRVMPVHWLFARLERPLREAARAEGKLVTLVTRGEETELDKMLVEQITDPVIQLVRNAIAHGIEPSAERRQKRKPEQGTVLVEARHQGDFVYLDVADDGRGLDFARIRGRLVETGRLSQIQVDQLGEAALTEQLFASGFSTRSAANELAGRGVGLDVVRENLARVGGELTVSTQLGEGTRFTIRLPLTTAITTALLFKVGGQVYALPAAHVVESDYVDPAQVAGSAAPGGPGALTGLTAGTLATRDGDVPLLSLHAVLGSPLPPGIRRLPAIVVALADRRFAVTCDKIVGPREIVVRSLGPLLSPLELYAGATISGAGKVQLVLDLMALAARVTAAPEARHALALQPPRVLFADDSRSIREAVSRILAAAGYAVQTAPDGWEAWELLKDHPFDLLVTDLEMPRLDGFDLIAKVRRDPELRELPILVLTSRTSPQNRLRADALGSTGFLTKPVNRRMFIARVGDAIRQRRS
jgi:chemotaxis protein histidine kinase CheA